MRTTTNAAKLVLDPDRIGLYLGSVILLLDFAYLIGLIRRFMLHHEKFMGVVRLFDLDAETNIPTAFSSLLIIFNACLLYWIANAGRRKGDRLWKYWLGLAAIFVFLSVDEFAELHEYFIYPLQNGLQTSGFLRFAWIIPYGVAVLVFGALYIRFLWMIPRRLCLQMLIAGGIYVLGAIGIEGLEGAYLDSNNDQWDLGYCLLVAVEETFEMIGMLIFAHALMTHIETQVGDVTISVQSKAKHYTQDEIAAPLAN